MNKICIQLNRLMFAGNTSKKIDSPANSHKTKRFSLRCW
jgi:hypothetical protein